MWQIKYLLAVVAVSATVSACAESGSQSKAKTVESVWLESMVAKNHVGLDRLNQTALQSACSNAESQVVSDTEREQLQQEATKSVAYPADGVFLGNWQQGEAIAGNGKGMQWSDNPNEPNGGNCYACHQMSPDEVAYGTVGPSLRNYGMRGVSEAMLKYTWAKIWNPQVYLVCSHMPRFGDAGILDEQQIRDVMAYLFDPASPVNRK
ncbi:sulfur oxidation c-type cytochrome SoxX [Microbulbifer pacificus]|uniref:Sulfur oxidation c-type cytochrome SoxX n=1 Tax=Microbulbifer pacificus TaxID=407164 RepID=A0AAU0MVS3_9GAMM|nr:sulfur oxidation c-type cytochrome SoxX [Microbulbifer pacificus]WOX04745.1 sulfur oxidation c-type cytochrome SoxX [Microbulbifer pacificus]